MGGLAVYDDVIRKERDQIKAGCWGKRQQRQTMQDEKMEEQGVWGERWVKGVVAQCRLVFISFLFVVKIHHENTSKELQINCMWWYVCVSVSSSSWQHVLQLHMIWNGLIWVFKAVWLMIIMFIILNFIPQSHTWRLLDVSVCPNMQFTVMYDKEKYLIVTFERLKPANVCYFD